MTTASDVNVGLSEMELGIHRLEKQSDDALALLTDRQAADFLRRLAKSIERHQEQVDRFLELHDFEVSRSDNGSD